MSPLINKNLPYDALLFEPIISLAQSFFVVAVRKEFPANSVAEFIAYAKANPKKVNYASGGSGSGSYLITLLLARSAAIEMVKTVCRRVALNGPVAALAAPPAVPPTARSFHVRYA